MLSLYETCIFDMCALEAGEAQLCGFLATAAEKCRWENNELENFQWRSETLCRKFKFDPIFLRQLTKSNGKKIVCINLNNLWKNLRNFCDSLTSIFHVCFF